MLIDVDDGHDRDAARKRAQCSYRTQHRIRQNSFSNNVRFADLVVMAERLHPIPFRTRP